MGNKEEKMKAVVKEVFVDFDEAENLANVVGEKDRNIKVIELQTDVTISRDGKGLLVKGQDSDVNLVVDLLNQLKPIFETNKLVNEEDIKRAIKVLSSDRNAKISSFLNEQINVKGKKHSIYPKSLNQKSYIDAINNNDLVFGVGPAGTGKTYLAMAMAVSALLRKDVKKIILSRPAVEAGEKLGFLPGDLSEKVNPYLRPLYDALYDFVDYDVAQEFIEKEVIEVAPLAFMRGRTLSNAFVILDEGQNTSDSQMKMLLTRLGQNSKCVITGDITQVDLPNGVKSGLKEAVTILKGIKGIEIVNFTTTDVIRHRLVANIISAYEKHSK